MNLRIKIAFLAIATIFMIWPTQADARDRRNYRSYNRGYSNYRGSYYRSYPRYSRVRYYSPRYSRSRNFYRQPVIYGSPYYYGRPYYGSYYRSYPRYYSSGPVISVGFGRGLGFGGFGGGFGGYGGGYGNCW